MKIINKITHRLSLFLTMLTLGIIGLVSPDTLSRLWKGEFEDFLDEMEEL